METQKIYQENSKRVREPAEMAQKISDQENIKRQMFEQKAQRVADLRARQNNLAGELNMVEKIQADARNG